MKDLAATEVANIIERFLNGTERYPQEWNDLVDSRTVEPQIEMYRKRCDELDPLVNRPEPADPAALEELRQIVSTLRSMGRT